MKQKRLEHELGSCGFRRSGEPVYCWTLRNPDDGLPAHFSSDSFPLLPKIPPNAARAWIVLLKRPTANSLQLRKNGSIEHLGRPCLSWQRIAKRHYRNGWRALQFEYELLEVSNT